MTRKLNIGMHGQLDGWETFNITKPADHIGDCQDLSRFHSGSFDVVYASHVLEHVGFREVRATVQGWQRIIRPGGKLYVSVPDMEMCSKILIHPDADVQTKQKILAVIYGGETDVNDYHNSGFVPEGLVHLMTATGFSHIERVRDFGLFNDCSTLLVNKEPLSINVIATK